MKTDPTIKTINDMTQMYSNNFWCVSLSVVPLGSLGGIWRFG